MEIGNTEGGLAPYTAKRMRKVRTPNSETWSTRELLASNTPALTTINCHMRRLTERVYLPMRSDVRHIPDNMAVARQR
jgi:hypothetical protein